MKAVDFIVAGAMKGGTSAAIPNLSAHPKIWMLQNEPHFFDAPRHWVKGVKWYLDKFKDASKPIWGEKTPLLGDLYTHARIKETFPKVKLIIILRNPIYRAYSQWIMELKLWIARCILLADRAHHPVTDRRIGQDIAGLIL